MMKRWISPLAAALGILVVACASEHEGSVPQVDTSETHPESGACGRGIKSCSAQQVGQPCDPNNLSVICSAQASGKYCCLASAP